MYKYVFNFIGKYGFDGRIVSIPFFTSIGQLVNYILLTIILIKIY